MSPVSHLASSSLTAVRRAGALVLVGVVAYGTVRALQRACTAPPHVPRPAVPRNSEDGVVVGFLKRALLQHFYVVRKGESLKRLHAWCEQYEHKPFLMNIFLRPHLVLSDPADVESVLLRQEARFCKGAGYDLVRGIIGDGLLAVGNKMRHRDHRRILAPIFSTANMRGLSNEVTRVHALRLLSTLFDVLQDSNEPSVVVNFSEQVNRMALGAIGEAAFRASRGESVEVRHAFDTLLSLNRLNYFCPYLRTRSQQEAKKLVMDVSEMLLEKNMSIRQPGDRRVYMDALIDALYDAFTPQDVVDHLVTVLFAGHDTTASTLQFLFAVLSSHPEVQEKLHQCLEEMMPSTCTCPTVEQLMQCEYLEATMNEVLRLYPAAPILYRDATETVNLPSGVAVPKGWTTVISVFSLHRNKNVFGADADTFRPERWIGEEGRQLRKRAGRCGFIPFSCGRRNCIGQEFARCEVLIVVAVLVRHLRLELVGEFPVTKYNITMMSKAPVYVRLFPRDGISVSSVCTKLTHSFFVMDSQSDASGVSDGEVKDSRQGFGDNAINSPVIAERG